MDTDEFLKFTNAKCRLFVEISFFHKNIIYVDANKLFIYINYIKKKYNFL